MNFTSITCSKAASRKSHANIFSSGNSAAMKTAKCGPHAVATCHDKRKRSQDLDENLSTIFDACNNASCRTTTARATGVRKLDCVSTSTQDTRSFQPTVPLPFYSTRTLARNIPQNNFQEFPSDTSPPAAQLCSDENCDGHQSQTRFESVDGQTIPLEIVPRGECKVISSSDDQSGAPIPAKRMKLEPKW